MKPVHRESNLDVDYVISYKIPQDGTVSDKREMTLVLTSARQNEGDCSVQEADQNSSRRWSADRSAEWQ